jgi:hypothetical protein
MMPQATKMLAMALYYHMSGMIQEQYIINNLNLVGLKLHISLVPNSRAKTVESPVMGKFVDSSIKKASIDIHIQLCLSGFIKAFKTGSFIFWHDIRNIDNWISWIRRFGQNNL